MLQAKANERIRQDQAGAWITDNLRITSRLNVEMGVRWDYFGSPEYESGTCITGTLRPAVSSWRRALLPPSAHCTRSRSRWPRATSSASEDHQHSPAGLIRIPPERAFCFARRLRRVHRRRALRDRQPDQRSERTVPARRDLHQCVSNGTVAFRSRSLFRLRPSSARGNPVRYRVPAETDEGVIRQYN